MLKFQSTTTQCTTIVTAKTETDQKPNPQNALELDRQEAYRLFRMYTDDLAQIKAPSETAFVTLPYPAEVYTCATVYACRLVN